MSNEEKILRKYFGAPKWKGRYTVDWCHLCDTAIIICPDCKNSSCNCGGCSTCLADAAEWKSVKSRVEEYLTPEEAQAYRKGLRLRKFILLSIEKGQKEIDWRALKHEGQLSERDEQMFKTN